MKYKCADRGSLRCPCVLMEAGQCYACAIAREGKCDCSEDWQGVCPYNEYLQHGKRAVEGGLSAELPAKIIRVTKYSDQLSVVRLEVTKGISRRCSRPGSFITAEALGCRVPLSVLQEGWDKDENTVRGWIETALQPAGPKTKELLKVREGKIWHIAGPFETGLAGRAALDRLTESFCAANEIITESPGESPFRGKFLVVARGTAIAPFINIKDRLKSMPDTEIMADDEKLSRVFLEKYMGGTKYETVSLAHDEEKILSAMDGARTIMLLVSPYYVERFLRLRPERKDDIIIPNHANMCCGAGVCGACSYTDKDGVTVRRCKCIL